MITVKEKLKKETIGILITSLERYRDVLKKTDIPNESEIDKRVNELNEVYELIRTFSKYV